MPKAGSVALQVMLCLVISTQSHGRSAAQLYRFKQMEPCPITQHHKGRCPGWEVDHITPLCAGGDDKTWNMQWLTRADHRLKTLVDVRECRRQRKRSPQPTAP